MSGRRRFCLALLGGGAQWLGIPSVAAVPSPGPAPVVPAASWIVLEAGRSAPWAECQADQVRDPASLTKLMTAYVVLSALRQGRLSLTEPLTVLPDDLARVAGDEARMGLRPGERMCVDELLAGLIVVSADDAAQVLARRVGGSEAGFARLMNDTARRLGMAASHFVSPSGITTPGHCTTARDLGRLSLRLSADFPVYHAYAARQSLRHAGVLRINKNRLLALDASVDGLKTGHTQAAGWCIAASALRGGGPGQGEARRIFAIVLGAPDRAARVEAARRLLAYGFQAAPGG